MRARTRRRSLATVVGSVIVGLAGCLGGDDSPDSAGSADSSAAPETTATTSFFVFGDVACHIAGDAASVETSVPIGQHGHGWEPGPDVQSRVFEPDPFAHGMSGFQPWADDICTSLEAGDSGVLEADASANVELHEIDVDGHVHDDEHAEESEMHDHGGLDPCFRLDPTRVATAIETFRDAFQSVDAANVDVYVINADAYRKTLSELDATFEDGLVDRERDVLLTAGHDAYSYLVDRYDFDIAAFIGISPDEEPSPRDIKQAQATIEEYSIRHVLVDPLEFGRAAQRLVSETDAENVFPLTSLPGVMAEWEGNDWGYVDIMHEVNLPSLRTALDAQ